MYSLVARRYYSVQAHMVGLREIAQALYQRMFMPIILRTKLQLATSYVPFLLYRPLACRCAGVQARVEVVCILLPGVWKQISGIMF